MNLRKATIACLLIYSLGSQFNPIINAKNTIPDQEYESMVQEDIHGMTGNESFARIEKSISKDLFDTTDAKLARKTAKEYINSLKDFDSHWKGNDPKLIGKPVPYYTDDSSAPLTYEWKVRCANMNDCGSIIVGVIDNVGRIMEAGTYGIANYERLGNGKDSHKNKLYYYSPFDQYIESSSGNDLTVDTIDPSVQFQKSKTERKDELKSRKDSIKSVRENGGLHFQSEDTGIASTPTTKTVTLTSAVAPLAVATNTIVDVQHMTPTSNCASAMPCYDQFNDIYGTITCPSGCSPTAMAIIFGYYDRIGVFPNLIGNSSILASDYLMDTTTRSMVNSIRGYMGTTCVGGQGSTTESNIKLGMQYARDRGYTSSINGTYTAAVAGVLFPKIKTEINSAKPLIGSFQSLSGGHSVVIFGYNDTSSIYTSQVHINYGWGKTTEKYVSIYNQLTSNDGLPGYKLAAITTVPVN